MICNCCGTPLLTPASQEAGVCGLCRKHGCHFELDGPTCYVNGNQRWALKQMGNGL